MMFVVFLLGAWIGAIVGALILGLSQAAALGDRQREEASRNLAAWTAPVESGDRVTFTSGTS